MSLLHLRTALLALSLASLALTGCPGPDKEDPLPDAGDTDAGSDAGEEEEPLTSSEQIQAVRDEVGEDAAHDPAIPVENVTVTFIRPAAGSDAAGFFVQAEKAGPALFVAVDPTTIDPAPAVGDVVSFEVTGTTVANDQHLVTGIEGLSVVESGFDVESLVQDLSASTDIVSGLNGYESELIQVTAHMDGDIYGCGAPNLCNAITTEGVPTAETDLRFRMLPEVVEAKALRTGCEVVIGPSPMWRFRTTAQVSAFTPEEVTVVTCPDLTVTGARASGVTEVRVTFEATLDAASVTAESFVIAGPDGALDVTAAVVDGSSVLLTTADQEEGVPYTLTIASTITDVNGVPVAEGSEVSFSGFSTQAKVVINEFNAHISGGCDLVELRVIEGGSMAGFTFLERNSSIITFPEGFEVQKNDLVVVHFNRDSETCTGEVEAPADETAAPDEQSHERNFPGAFDFWVTDSGLTNTNNAYSLLNGSGAFVDFVMHAVEGSAHSGATATAANLAADAGHWPALDEPYVTATIVETAVLHVQPSNAGSLQRINDGDTDSRDDWTQAEVGESSFGVLNAGQAELP